MHPDAAAPSSSTNTSLNSPTDPPLSSLDELVRVMHRLRAPGGCAWDAEQTHTSLVKYLIEETHELIDAIESGTRDDLLEELGDVLYQVLFHADIAQATAGEEFDIQDVAARMTAKMVSRHPHVFSDAVAETADDVAARWEQLKAVEKPERTSVLDGIPMGMPALALADKLIGRAEKVGIQVSAVAGLSNFEVSPSPQTESELGAALLALTRAARGQGLDAERALRSSLRGLRDEVAAAEAAGRER